MNRLLTSSTKLEKPIRSPEGVPLRPGEWSCVPLVFLFGALAFGVLAASKPPIFAFIGIVTMLGTLVFKSFQTRHYDRIGWYKKHEVVVPPLPFTIAMDLHPIIPYRSFRLSTEKNVVFGEDAINLGGIFSIPYSQIDEVHTDCFNVRLTGIIVTFTAGSLPDDSDDILGIPDYRSGERTRNLLAILRANAPQATFTGPKWVEDGWVPRFGFNCPARVHGGSAGP